MEKTEITDGMRSWKEQLAFEAAEKKRMRIEWAKAASEMAVEQDMTIPDLAKKLGMERGTLQKVLRHAGIKTAYEREYTTTKAMVRTEAQQARAIMLKQLRDRAARKIAARYKPDYARMEAAREMHIEMGARVHTHEAQA